MGSDQEDEEVLQLNLGVAVAEYYISVSTSSDRFLARQRLVTASLFSVNTRAC